jgi:hypothetical protein
MTLRKTVRSTFFLFLATSCNGQDALLGESSADDQTADGAATKDGTGGACVPPKEDAGKDSGPSAEYCFACGSAATCDGRIQLCEDTTGGVTPGGVDLFTCVAIPAACTSDPSCACVTAVLSVSSCSAAGTNLTVLNAVP